MDAARDPHLGIAEESDGSSVATSAPDGPTPSPRQPTPSPLSYALGILVWVGIGLIVAWNTEAGNAFLRVWWWLIAIAIGVAILLAYAAGRLGWAVNALNQSEKARATIVIFVVLPLLIAGIALIAVLPPSYQVTALRSVFLLVVALLPGSLWWLFISQRKASLLNGYVTDLGRLGLLARPKRDTETAKAERSRRIVSYLQKFEATYGTLEPRQKRQVLDGTFQPSPLDAGPPVVITATSTATVPVAIATVLIALGWLLALPPLIEPAEGSAFLDRWLTALRPAQDGVAFAFLGAYFFSIQMLFRRYVLSDLQATAYVAISIRIVLAVIGTWAVVTAFESEFDERSAMVLGFVIGVFPRIAWQAIQSVIQRVTGLVLRIPSLRPGFPLDDLDGLTVWHESRLEEEDIENVPSMASASLPDLLLNTRFSSDLVIGWVDQAILYTHLGEPSETKGRPNAAQRARDALQDGYGIRTASAFCELAVNDGPDEISTGPDSAIHIGPLAQAMATEPNLDLIQRWRDLEITDPGQPETAANTLPSIP